MARPGETTVQAAARAFMRQYCNDSGHPYVYDQLSVGRFEINGQDIMPAMAAALLAIGAIGPEATPSRPTIIINNDGSPYRPERRYTGFRYDSRGFRREF